MKIIKEYLDSLFLTVPTTPETQRAKEDLLAIMEDHYHELIAEGKSEHEAIGAVISEFGSIDEILAELDVQAEKPEEPSFEEERADAIDLEEAFDFWGTTRKFAFELSLGIFLICLSVSASMFMDNNEYGGLFFPLAILSFFILVLGGIGFIVSGSMKYVAAKKLLEDRPLSNEVLEEAKEQVLDYEKSFRVGLISGIGLCVLSIPLLIIFVEYFFAELFAVSVFFGTVGVGVFLIVYSSVVRNGFLKMAAGQFFVSDSDEPGPRATRSEYGEATPFIMLLRNAYWPAVVVMYLLWSSITHSWHYSWLIFPIAAFLNTFLVSVLKQHR
ncbi:permease prefix domain 1-containing protein [Enterococcus olivae]